MHRDVKPDNVLFSTYDRKTKLTDFTVARNFQDHGKLFSSEGTPEFTAPECENEPEFGAKPTDVWSFGMSLFTYVAGTVPFFDEEAKKKKIEAIPDFNLFSDELKDLIKSTVNIDPAKRIPSKELTKHKWFLNK